MKIQRENLKKIILAVVLSASCYSLTHIIYLWTEPANSNQNNHEPIAYTTRVNEEVQRRPVARMIWHLLNPGEPVFPGEAIRTSSAGEVQIQFVGSDRVLDLEADTMIILTKKENDIALDLLDGSVFLAQGESSSGSKLTLNSKQGSIDLSKATVSLSKNADKIDLQVVKGEALLNSEGAQKSIKSGQSDSKIQILEPLGDKPHFAMGLQNKNIKFKWSGATVGSPIELWLGTQRKNLKLQNKILNTAQAEIQVPLKPGKYFWQLRSPASGDSQIQRLEIISLMTAQPLTPAPEQSIVFEKDPGKLEFTWSNPDGADSTTFEVSKDPAFTQVVHTEVLPTSKTFSIKEIGKGKFYWRVSSYYSNHQQMVSSPIRSFETEIGARKLTSITWDEKLESQKFFVDKPKLDLSWKEQDQSRTKSWIVRIAPNEAELNDPNSKQTIKIETQNKNMSSVLPQGGRWIASVEGVDAAGNRISKSEAKDFQVNPLPLLQAPKILPLEGDLTASRSGDLNLEWMPIEGAQEYWVTFKNSEGKETQNKKFTKNSATFQDLMPGTYEVDIFAKDEHGRKSEPTPSRKLVVPDSSGLSAPKLRRVKVN